MPQAEQRAHRLRDVPFLIYAFEVSGPVEARGLRKVHRRRFFFRAGIGNSEAMSATTQYGMYGNQPSGGTDTCVCAPATSALRDMIVPRYPHVIQNSRRRAGISPHYFSTMNSNRNVRSPLETNSRCYVDSTIDRGGRP